MLKILIAIVTFTAACGTLRTERTNSYSSTCKKIEFCMIGYHNPPGNECACVPD